MFYFWSVFFDFQLARCILVLHALRWAGMESESDAADSETDSCIYNLYLQRRLPGGLTEKQRHIQLGGYANGRGRFFS